LVKAQDDGNDVMKRNFLKIEGLIKKFFLIDDSPHKVAAGAALGVFWGIMPGEGVATTIVTASIFRFNRLSAIAGILAVNMWMTVVAMPFAAICGGFLFGVDPETLTSNFRSTFDLGLKYFFSVTIFSHLLLPLIVGFFVVSLVISLAIYFFLYFLLKYKKIRFK
jgi:uncharacterized protein (DUF2062 family)